MIVSEKTGSHRVYVAKADCSPALYKIGYTEDTDVTRRIKSLQVGCPWPLTLVTTIPCRTQAAEAVMHERLAHRRVRGEWFELDDADVEWLRSLRDVDHADLARSWLQLVPPEPKRAAVIADLLFNTFEVTRPQVENLISTWLGDEDLGEKAVAVAMKRRRESPRSFDDRVQLLRRWMAEDPERKFTVSDAVAVLGFPQTHRMRVAAGRLLREAGAQELGNTRFYGKKARYWAAPGAAV